MTITDERPRAASEAARRAMIDSQLRTSGVNEPWVLNAMASVAREDFVPEAMKSAAYIDRAIPLENGRALPAPLVQAKMLSEAAPTQDDKVLLVGDGAGYLAALVRPLAGSLDAVDPAKAVSKAGDGSYSLVIVDGAIEHLPDALATQLAEDGRIVTGLVQRGVTRLAAGRKAGGAVALLPLAELGIPVLPEFAAPKSWSF
ncbi:MAG: protein-L-isoaspartate O-methyltransferase [Sphingomonadaceae bacterium]|jgi:protein-L-isoaspartate(D-aspartate) O-methyltransferase